MSNGEQKSGREVLENSIKNIGSFLASRGLPGKAKLNTGHPHAPAGERHARPSSAQPPQHQLQQHHSQQPGAASGAAAGAGTAAGAGSSASTSSRQSPEPLDSSSSHQASQQQLEAGFGRLGVHGPGGSADLDAGRGAAATSGGGAPPGPAAAAGSDAGVSQSRASSQIRVRKFHRLLDEQLIDIDALRELSWSGIPAELRPTCWKLLLGYMPPNKSRQAAVIARKRREYADMVPEFYDIQDSQRSEEEVGALRQVAVDVPRTAPNVPFFHEPVIQQSLQRLLYIWGIRHPASGYVQGMNDLVTPFVAVFLSEVLQGQLHTWTTESLTEGVMLNVEADCYWCLSKLLDGIQDHYTAAQPGIQRTVFRVKELVSKNNAAIVSHLEAEGIDFLQFAFRWVNCLLIREVPFGAALRLWDTYLAEGGRFADFLVYVCAAFLASWQRDVCRLEFQDLMMFLQKLPTQDWGEAHIESMLSSAFVLRNTWGSAQSHLQT